MSRITNLSNLRIPHFNSWKTIWYEKNNNYSYLFFRDFQLYQYLKGLFYRLKMMTDDFYFENILNNTFFIKVNIYLYKFQVKKYYLSFFTSQYLVYYFILKYIRHRYVIKNNINIIFFNSSILYLINKENNIFSLINTLYYSYYFINTKYLFHTSDEDHIYANLSKMIKYRLLLNKSNIYRLNKSKNKSFLNNILKPFLEAPSLHSLNAFEEERSFLIKEIGRKLKFNLYYFFELQKYLKSDLFNYYNKLIAYRKKEKKKKIKKNKKHIFNIILRELKSYVIENQKLNEKFKKTNSLRLKKKLKKQRRKNFNLFYFIKWAFKKKYNRAIKGKYIKKYNNSLYLKKKYFLLYFFFKNLLYFFSYTSFELFYFFLCFFKLFNIKFNLLKNSIIHFTSLNQLSTNKKLKTFYYLNLNNRKEISRSIYDERIYYDFFFYFFFYTLILNIEKTIYLFTGNQILFIPQFFIFNKTPIFLSAKLVNDFVLTELEKGMKIYKIFKSLQSFQFREKINLKTDLRLEFDKYNNNLHKTSVIKNFKKKYFNECIFKYVKKLSDSKLSELKYLEKEIDTVKESIIQMNTEYKSKLDKYITEEEDKRYINLINEKIDYLNEKINEYKNIFPNWINKRKYNMFREMEKKIINNFLNVVKFFDDLYNNEILSKRYPLLGLRIECNGPTKRGKQARIIAYHQVIKNHQLFGRMPNKSILADIDYYQSFARTKQGSIGIKVWVFFYSKTYDKTKKLISVI